MLLVSVHRLFFAPIYEFKYLQSTFEETEVVSDPQPAHATIKLEEYVKEGKKALTESRLIEAIDFFSLALERTDGTYPVDPEFMGQALIGRAATNVRLRNYAEGLIDAQAVSSLLPESDQGPTLSGLCYLGLLDLDLAKKGFTLALTRNPDSRFALEGIAALQALEIAQANVKTGDFHGTSENQEIFTENQAADAAIRAMHALLETPDSDLHGRWSGGGGYAESMSRFSRWSPFRLGRFGPSRRMEAEEAASTLLSAARRAAARQVYRLWARLYRSPWSPPDAAAARRAEAMWAALTDGSGTAAAARLQVRGMAAGKGLKRAGGEAGTEGRERGGDGRPDERLGRKAGRGAGTEGGGSGGRAAQGAVIGDGDSGPARAAGLSLSAYGA